LARATGRDDLCSVGGPRIAGHRALSGGLFKCLWRQRAVKRDRLGVWFTVQESNQIGRITTPGSATEYAIPGCGSQCSVAPGGITAGVGRTIWFTNTMGNQVDRLAY